MNIYRVEDLKKSDAIIARLNEISQAERSRSQIVTIIEAGLDILDGIVNKERRKG